MKDPDAILKNALERLAAALTAQEVGSHRIEMIEDALLCARMALGQETMTKKEHEEFLSNLETLGIQILVDAMDRQELVLYRAKVTFSDDTSNQANIIITTHPVLGPLLDKHVEQMVSKHHPDKPPKTYDVN